MNRILAENFYNRNSYDSSIIYINRAINCSGIHPDDSRFHPELIELYVLHRKIHRNNANYHESLKISEFIIANTKNDTDLFKTLVNESIAKGNILWRLNSYDNAISSLNATLDLVESRLNEFPKEFIRINILLGIVHSSLNQINKSIDYYNLALHTINIKGLADANLFFVYSNLANSYVKISELDSAIMYYHKSLEYDSKLSKTQKALTMQNLATAYIGKEKYIKADGLLLKALNINLEVYGQSHPYVADAYYNLGLNAQKMSEPTRAIKLLNTCLEIRKDLIDSERARLSIVYNTLADINLETNHYELARSYLDSAFLFQKRTIVLDNSIFSDQLEAMYSFIGYLTYFEKTESYLESNCLDSLLNITYPQLRMAYYTNNAKIISLAKEVIEYFYHLYYQKYSDTNNDSLPDQLFSLSQYGKSKNLQIQFANSKALKLNVSQKFLSEDKSLRDSIILCLNKLSSNYSYYDSLLFNLKLKHDSFTKSLEDKYPKYYQAKHSDDFLKAHEVQKKLSNSELLIDFFARNDDLFCMALSDKLITLQKIEKKLIENSMDSLINSIVDKHNLNHKRIKNLIITPDGPLWNINFDLLLTEESKSDDPKEMPYLFRKYAISYAYSASLLFQDLTREKSHKKSLLAFSYGETDTGPGNQIALRSLRSSEKELPGSRQEIRAVASLLDGDYFYGNYASEKQFKDIASDYQILHLAVHGETDEEEPENSKLYFYSKGDTLEDGKLHAFELYNMEMDADLAVLSACNTGSGEIVNGEGIMSLGRAFAYAGVNCLLLTRHEVSDAVAPEIMKVFYRELKNGKRKSEALRQAKLEYLENANSINSDPFYWGSFYILGDDSPLELDSETEYWKWAAGTILFMLIAIFWIRNRKFSH